MVQMPIADFSLSGIQMVSVPFGDFLEFLDNQGLCLIISFNPILMET